MDLALFPLDTQTCHLTIASYGWAANDLVYMWKVESRSVLFVYPRYFLALTGAQGVQTSVC